MKIAFTSCSNAYRQNEQPIWSVIRKQEPDLLILLGDNVYIGKEGYDPPAIFGETTVQAQERILRSKYDAQVNEPNFKRLLDSVDMLAVWDNHDFGLPGGAYKPLDPSVIRYGSQVSDDFRRMTRGLFDKYIKSRSLVPDSEEVYCPYRIGNIKFIMVDTRSFQTRIDHNPNPTLLGKEQEDWLENELVDREADIKVICSGMAYSEGKACWKAYEDWDRKFNRMIQRTSKILFLGGNIHTNVFNEHITLDDTIIPGNHPHPESGNDIISTARSTPRKTFYEAVSSGVGRNYQLNNKGVIPEDDDKEDGIPANNYGIIEITDSLVTISLYGQRKNNIHYAEIDRGSWRLTGHWKMKNHSR